MEMKTGILALIALSAIMRAPAAAPEPKAVEIARAMMQAMGGEAAWKQARYVRFDFVVKTRDQVRIERKHLWDRQTGRYRLEEKSANDSPGVVLFNVRDRRGTAYVSGKKLEGEAAAAALKGAYRTYRMDIDWLTLPWRWLDPGVHLKYVGEKSLQGQAFDLVEVTVDQPGAAEGMRYNAYVSRRSHLLEHWSVGADNGLWDWQYTKVGGLQLASDHINTQKNASISMGDVKVLDNVDEAFLTDPARRMATLK
jgi:hypothetical protein